jgi:hypothetical protein
MQNTGENWINWIIVGGLYIVIVLKKILRCVVKLNFWLLYDLVISPVQTLEIKYFICVLGDVHNEKTKNKKQN